jgi:hypothetical protein
VLLEAHLNPENKDDIVVDYIVVQHTCIGDAQGKRSAAIFQD